MGTTRLATEQSNCNPEVFSWLKTLPLAPVYHPTIQEFKDPIAYIFKIEKEASNYGICKIVPPVPPQSKKTVLANFNSSFSARNPKNQPTFTTRQQQVGFCPRKHCPIQKSVWQSGEHYTLQQFEAKAKGFAKNYLKNRLKKALSPLDIETLYWKANGDRPFSVEYANDMPGSGFVPLKERKGMDAGEMVNGTVTVGETAWNMRGISRDNGSLLRFMKEEIPGVTSPMVYIAMMFSWFAWHVEDHDLHSLNYLHIGAGKTWYGVPRDAALAFEEVIRVHGYGDEINPLVTFTMLGEKTSVMSPEVLIKAGVPCCRLVQNAGEFVVTFPQAYHSGFSHGFNCGEASNIATPEWLRFAKDAAIRRAAINYPPMVSHYQLLYDFALGMGSRLPISGTSEPRSSRLKDRKKGEGETLVKRLFLQDVTQNNNLLHTLGKESTIVLLPPNSPEKFSSSNLSIGSKYNAKRMSFSSSQTAVKEPGQKAHKETYLEGNQNEKQCKACYSVKAKFSSVSQNGEHSLRNDGDDGCTLPFETQNSGSGREGTSVGSGLSKPALFSCVKCGIWPFACAAIVQPTELAAHYLMSAECNSLNDWISGSRASSDGMIHGYCDKKEPDSSPGYLEKNVSSNLYDVPIQCVDYDIPMIDQGPDLDESPDYRIQKEDETFAVSPNKNHNESSALGLLAMTYRNSSDSEDDDIRPHSLVYKDDSAFKDGLMERNFQRVDSPSSPSQHEDNCGKNFRCSPNFSKFDSEDEVSPEADYLHVDGRHVTYGSGNGSAIDNHIDSDVHCSPNGNVPFSQMCNKDYSRIHVFCLEHAMEVEARLRPFGGVHILLLCHPDYPKVEAAAKLLAEELEMDYPWNDISFREATEKDEEQIQLALESEEAMPKNGDWAVKLGINLYYSATLCRSPLYSKQMPYNPVIYDAFSCSSPSNSLLKPQTQGKGTGKQKKVIVAGNWCGKVWMSNQVHHLLLHRDVEEEEDEGTLSGCIRNTEKSEKKPESPVIVERPSVSRKTGRKRKMKVENRPVKKTKFIETEIADSEYEDSYHSQSYQEEERIGIGNRKPKTVGSFRKEDRYPDKEIATGEMEVSVDSESHEYYRGNRWMKKFEQESPQPCIVYKRMNQRFHSPPGDDIEGCLTRPKRIRKQKSMLIEDEMEAGFDSGKRITRQNDFSPEVEMDDGPSTRLRKGIVKSSGDLDTKLSLKEKPIKNKEKEAPPRKGPRVMLPVPKASERKGPAMRLPIIKAPTPARAVPGKRPTLKCGALKPPTMKRSARRHKEREQEEHEYICDIEGCAMSFGSKEELSLHKRNICLVDGCDKKFFSHKYLIQHRRVHEDYRPLKCPWSGCKMTFKWAWARTEHIRVHTGARPYVCGEPGCGQTFRFVSDFSRHKRKTGHSAKKKCKA